MDAAIDSEGLVAGLRQIARLARQIEDDLWRNAQEVAEAKERARLAPIIEAINAEARGVRDLLVTACYATDSGFDYIEVELGDGRYLKIEDSFADYPRVGIYPAGAEIEGREVPIFDLRGYGKEMENITRLDQLNPKMLAEMVADLCEFALGKHSNLCPDCGREIADTLGTCAQDCPNSDKALGSP